MGATAFPRRSRRFGIGKEIGGAVYVHRSYESVLGSTVQHAKALIPPDFPYAVVKLRIGNGAVSFVESADFDSCPEPQVGAIWTTGRDGSTRYLPPLEDPWIYHHKWLMVDDAYRGFDVEESRERSRSWLALSGVDKRRVGRRSYWLTEVAPLLSMSE